MTSTPVVRESRKSTRVRLKVVIEAHGLSEPLKCEGETLVVNLHGALILSAVALRVGMRSRFISLSQTKALQPRSCISIQTNRDTAESNWRNLKTFGDCCCRRMIGMGGDGEPALIRTQSPKVCRSSYRALAEIVSKVEDGPKAKSARSPFRVTDAFFEQPPPSAAQFQPSPPTEVVNSSRVPQSRTDGPDCRKYARLQLQY
jgi:hypothetical protein